MRRIVSVSLRSPAPPQPSLPWPATASPPAHCISLLPDSINVPSPHRCRRRCRRRWRRRWRRPSASSLAISMSLRPTAATAAGAAAAAAPAGGAPCCRHGNIKLPSPHRCCRRWLTPAGTAGGAPAGGDPCRRLPLHRRPGAYIRSR